MLDMENIINHEKCLIGILMMNTSFIRIPGDIGNPATFDFPVEYEYIIEATPNRVVIDGDKSLIPYFLKAARNLEEKGVKAITTSCGFLSLFQNDLRKKLSVPIFTSSLIQIPMISRMLSPNRYVGIITANSKSLSKEHLKAVGISEEINIEIEGMENQYYFRNIITQDPTISLKNNEDNIKKEMIKAGESLLKKNSKISALVFECTNMPPYAKAVQESLKLPVFDIVTLTNLVYSSLKRSIFI